MKATFFIALFWVSIAITSPTAHAQGQLVFANRVGVTGIDLPVFIGGTQSGPGLDYSAQLYLVGDNNSLTPLFPITTFQAPGQGIAAIKSRYLDSVVVQVPGVAGESAAFLIRAWLTSLGSYENAIKVSGNQYGQSKIFQATPTVPPAPPGNLDGLTSGFEVGSFIFPEPSVFAIAILGGLALVFVNTRPLKEARSER